MDALVNGSPNILLANGALVLSAGLVFQIQPVVIPPTVEITEGSVWRGTWRGVSRGER